MSFTRPQQAKYRPLVDQAWRACAHPSAVADKTARRQWYEHQLLTVVGVRSTIPLNRGRDYDVLMAHFESLADDGTTYWQQRAETGDANRILHAVFKGGAPYIGTETITPHYLRGIAKQLLRLDHLPHLRTLKQRDLNAITRALAIHRKRHLNP